jgi:hypothetical protein
VPDRLTERFTALADDVDRLSRTVPTTTVRARGERRRRNQLWVGASTIAGVVVVVAGLIAVSLSMAPTAGPEPAATDPTAENGLPARISPDLRLPHDGEPGWTRSDRLDEPGAYNPCGRDDVTQVDRIDAVTLRGPGRAMEQVHSPTRLTEQVLLFRDVETAAEALAELGHATTECGWSGGRAMEALTVTGHYPADRGGTVTEIRDAVVVLRLNALVLHTTVVTGALMSSGDDEAIAATLDGVCQTMRLCGPADKCADPVALLRPDTAAYCLSPHPTGVRHAEATFTVTLIPSASPGPTGGPTGSPDPVPTSPRPG